ncbi:MAG: flagellar hook-length control protein FliK [Alphaproteobacteria bacterium]|nr:flagellar hook-length control protein FliK [Alphaproteobacteria bacterium]
MQISELNTNLLQAFGEKKQPISEENAEMQFSDLLQIAQNDKNSVTEPQKDLVESNGDKVSLKKVSSREVKPEDNRISNPQNEVKNSENKAPQTDKKVKNQTNNKENNKVNTDSSEKGEIAETPATQETTQTTQSESSGGEIEQAVLPENPIVVDEIANNIFALVVNPVADASIEAPMPEETSEIVIADVAESTESVDANPNIEQNIMQQEPQVTEVNNVENVSDTENVVNEIPQEAETIIKTDVPEEAKVKSQNKPQQAPLQNVIEPQNENIEVANEIVRFQEEKIAEKLPDNAKLEIKVSVQNDSVEAGEKHQTIAAPVLAEEVDIPEQSILQDVSEQNPETQVASVKNDKTQMAPTAVFIENVAAVNEVARTSGQNETIVAEVVQAPTAAVFTDQVVAEHIKVNEVADFKNVDSKNLTRDVAEQIKVNITQSAIKGVDKIEIQLKPADLGKIEIKLQIGRDGQLHAHITAAHAETLEILQKDISSLKDAFAGAGYLTDDGSFSFARQGEENNEREKMREFIGEIITHDVEEEMAANDYITADGVNIRV